MAVKWKPAPERWVAAFDAAVSERTDIERKKMFGYSAAFANGNLAVGLHQDGLVLRLNESDRESLLRDGGRPFEPMPGRFMREYVVAPDALATDASALRTWFDRAIAYASSVPAKPKKRAKKR